MVVDHIIRSPSTDFELWWPTTACVKGDIILGQKSNNVNADPRLQTNKSEYGIKCDHSASP